MSPRPLRYPSPASGDVTEAGGRHRRPESLASAPSSASFRVSTLLEDDTWVPGPRSARHQRSASSSSLSSARSASSARHSASSARTTTRSAARRAAAHRAAPVRPPVTGSHRAPGTLPIESWLLMGKKRQQVMLASLVAVGLLLVAFPGARGGGDSIDAVNAAAAARAAGNHAAQKSKGNGSGDKRDPGTEPAKVIPADSAPAGDGHTPEATATIRPGAKKTGPGHSLRTTGSNVVALTFDDGPDPAQTPRILALLAQYDVKATFCLVGQQAEKHPDMVRQIVAAGHTLCNHTWNHSLTIGKDKPEQIQADLARTNAAIRAAVPDATIPFFRAPGGNFTDRLVGLAADDGMTSLYWQVDPADWNHKAGETDAAHTARVVAEIKKHVRPGSIVLSHDFNQPDTIAAYQELLPWLKANFTLGIPGDPDPAPAATTPPTASPAPTETPAPPDPSTPAAPADPGAGAAAGPKAAEHPAAGKGAGTGKGAQAAD
ncbi:MAG TPA: polysaccharide deacetylase family protein [Actinoplanes sp.]|nr:polysaccharide deacetylase family protein [Actinoplanes sp.]